MSQEFYVQAVDGDGTQRIRGPLNAKQLREWVKKGIVDARTLISKDKQKWVPAGQVRGLSFPVQTVDQTVSQYYYSRDGQQFGPIEFASLIRLSSTNSLGEADLVWTEGWPSWIPANTVPGLFVASTLPSSFENVEGQSTTADMAPSDGSASRPETETRRSMFRRPAVLRAAVGSVACLVLGGTFLLANGFLVGRREKPKADATSNAVPEQAKASELESPEADAKSIDRPTFTKRLDPEPAAKEKTAEDSVVSLLNKSRTVLEQGLSEDGADRVSMIVAAKDVAAAYARWGSVDDTLSLLQSIKDGTRGTGQEDGYLDAVQSSAIGFAEAGRIDEARRLLPELDPDFSRPRAEVELIAALAKDNQADKATAEFESLYERITAEEFVFKMHAVYVVSALGKAKMYDEAQRCVKHVAENLENDPAVPVLQTLARCMAENDEPTKALKLRPDGKQVSLFWDMANAEIAVAFARQGLWANAMSEAIAIESLSRQVRTKVRIAVETDRRGDGKQAQLTMTLIGNIAEDLSGQELLLTACWITEGKAKVGRLADAETIRGAIATGYEGFGKNVALAKMSIVIADGQTVLADPRVSVRSFAQAVNAFRDDSSEMMISGAFAPAAVVGKRWGRLRVLVSIADDIRSPVDRIKAYLALLSGITSESKYLLL